MYKCACISTGQLSGCLFIFPSYDDDDDDECRATTKRGGIHDRARGGIADDDDDNDRRRSGMSRFTGVVDAVVGDVARG